MSAIDRGLEELQRRDSEPPPLSVPDAIAAILVASVCVDGTLTIEESARLQNVASTSRLCRAVPGPANAGSGERAVTLLNERGLASVSSASAAALPPEVHATAFPVAVDVVLSDGRVEPREKAYIDSVQAALGVDDSTALKIVEVLLIKNRA